MTQDYGSMDTTTVGNEARCSTADKKLVVSEFRRALPQFCVVGVKNLILLGWGLILGFPTILIPGLQGKSNDNSTIHPDFELSDQQISWIGSINVLFVPIGCLISGLFMEALGKRRMMQLLNVPMLAAWALFYFATDITQIYIALGLSGMSGGLLEAPLLVYIAETVEPKYRGMLTASGTATVYGGVCLSFIIGSMMHWKKVAALSAIVPFCAFIAVFFVPETPYWLVAKNRVHDAHKSLQWLRGWVSQRNVETEFKDIISSVEDLKAHKKTLHTIRQDSCVSQKIVQSTSNKLKPFTKRNFIAPFALIVISFVFSHFSGLTPLQTYSIQILHSYQVPINEYYATIFLGVAQLIGCLIGMAFVRASGKRRLVFASFIGCGICFCAVATHGYISSGSNQFDLVPNATSLNEPVDNLEKTVLNTIVSLRNRYRIEQDTGNFASQIDKKIQRLVDQNSFNASNYTHIDPEILTETQQLLQEIRHFSNLSNDARPKMLQQFIGIGMNLSLNDNKPNSIRLDTNFGNSISNSTIRDDVHVQKLFELLNITRSIIVTFMPNVLPAHGDSNLTVARVNEIEIDMWNVFVSNVTVMESHLVEKVNELSITLANAAKKIRLGSLAETDTNYRWIPLILLLGGSMFAHCGSKLFPWMLIGEVYQMEVRSTAAGMSSAIGYLVSFLSNKLFLTMVATLTLNGTFYFFSTVSLIAVVILYFTLPETENRTLLEIQAFFDKKPNRNNARSNGTNSTIC